MPYPTQIAALQPAQYQPPHRKNEGHELRTKVTNLEQAQERLEHSNTSLEQLMRKMNSLLESFIMAQQTQGRFPA